LDAASTSVTFDMVVLKLLEPFANLPFPGFGGQSSTSLRTLRGVSIMSHIWAYRAAYGRRQDYWFMQGCSAAAKAVVFTMELGSVQEDTFVKACRFLYEAGDQLPLANQLLLVLRRLQMRHEMQIPGAAAKIFSGLQARTQKTVLTNIRLLFPAATADEGPALSLDTGSTHDVAFLNKITDINTNMDLN
jgi:hypothetical protein